MLEPRDTVFDMAVNPPKKNIIPGQRLAAARTAASALAICWLLAPLLVLNPPPKAFAESGRFRLNPEASQISASVKDPFGNPVTGTLRLRQGEARGEVNRLLDTASVELTIEAASYNSNLGLRDQDIHQNHLEVKQYPRIRFESTGIVKFDKPGSPDEPWFVTLKGRLELHGVKREVVIPIRLLYQSDKIIAQGEFRFLLEDFKITVPQLLFWQAGNEVAVEFRIIGARESEK